MVEVVSGVVHHAKALHDALRAKVRCSGECHDFVPVERIEGEVERGVSAFGCVAAAPVVERKALADLVCRSEGRLKRNFLQDDNAGKRRAAAHLDSPPSEAVSIELLPHRRGHSPGGFARIVSREEFRDAWIRIHLHPRFYIGVAPAA